MPEYLGKYLKLKTAMSILKKEGEFLGLNWGDLEHLIQEQPTTFSEKVLNAYNTYREHTRELAEEA